MAEANDSSGEEDGRNRDEDVEGQGGQELGGAKPAKPAIAAAVKRAKKDGKEKAEKAGKEKAPPIAKVVCCIHQGGQLALVQRKMILVVSMLYAVVPDASHRDKKSSWKFFQHLFTQLCKLHEPFDFRNICQGK